MTHQSILIVDSHFFEIAGHVTAKTTSMKILSQRIYLVALRISSELSTRKSHNVSRISTKIQKIQHLFKLGLKMKLCLKASKSQMFLISCNQLYNQLSVVESDRVVKKKPDRKCTCVMPSHCCPTISFQSLGLPSIEVRDKPARQYSSRNLNVIKW